MSKWVCVNAGRNTPCCSISGHLTNWIISAAQHVVFIYIYIWCIYIIVVVNTHPPLSRPCHPKVLCGQSFRRAKCQRNRHPPFGIRVLVGRRPSKAPAPCRGHVSVPVHSCKRHKTSSKVWWLFLYFMKGFSSLERQCGTYLFSSSLEPKVN